MRAEGGCGDAFIRLRNGMPALEEAMRDHLADTAFRNSYLLHPRRHAGIAREVCACFLDCMESGADGKAAELGERLAREGMGAGPILGLASKLRLSCSAAFPSEDGPAAHAREAAEGYTTSLLEGFIKGMESELLREQDRIRNAFIDAHGLR